MRYLYSVEKQAVFDFREIARQTATSYYVVSTEYRAALYHATASYDQPAFYRCALFYHCALFGPYAVGYPFKRRRQCGTIQKTPYRRRYPPDIGHTIDKLLCDTMSRSEKRALNRPVPFHGLKINFF